jgi:hypothetical protein
MRTSTLTIFIIIMNSFFAGAQNAREISDKASQSISLEAMEMVASLKVINQNGNERVQTLSMASRKFNGVSKTLMKFIEPADVKGTTLLIFDYENKEDDLWIYMPALRKVRRIVSSEKGKNFMGSEFTNADMSKPMPDDFNYTLLGETNLDGKACWKVESTCKNETVEDAYGFSRRVTTIEKSNFLAHKIEYYDSDNELLRVQSISDYQKQANGGYFAFYMEMKNVQNQRRSIMKVEKFQMGSALPEAHFSPNSLEK